MKKGIIFEIFTLFILGITGWLLFNSIKRVELTNPEIRKIKNYNNMVFLSGEGIDVLGNKIDPFLGNELFESESIKLINSFQQEEISVKPKYEVEGDSSLQTINSSNKNTIVAFLLRYDSLDADLKFWNDVNEYLLKYKNIKMLGYCENEQCVNAIKLNSSAAHFSILEYGTVADMQAIIAADASGEFWVRKNEAKKIKWRNRVLTPKNIAISIGVEQ